MKGFKVEGQHVGAAQTETVAHPGECRHFGHTTKLHSFKSHNTHEDPRFAGPLPVLYMYVCSSVCMVYIRLYMVIHALQVATSADTFTEF